MSDSTRIEPISIRLEVTRALSMNMQKNVNNLTELTYDVIWDHDVNAIMFRLTYLQLLSNAVWILKIGPVVSELEGGGGGAQNNPPPPVGCVMDQTPVRRGLRYAIDIEPACIRLLTSPESCKKSWHVTSE